MVDHRDEGPIDKIKDALDPDRDDVDSDDDLATDRPSGWAGVDDALGGSHNRPAGPDYGGREDTTDAAADDTDAATASRREEDL
ncbi:MAG: hypothetical protein H0U86_11480 [Chloroflexi bacterium]|nr:hypothetical protein [Chloroflexota bacterium]